MRLLFISYVVIITILIHIHKLNYIFWRETEILRLKTSSSACKLERVSNIVPLCKHVGAACVYNSCPYYVTPSFFFFHLLLSLPSYSFSLLSLLFFFPSLDLWLYCLWSSTPPSHLLHPSSFIKQFIFTPKFSKNCTKIPPVPLFLHRSTYIHIYYYYYSSPRTTIYINISNSSYQTI